MKTRGEIIREARDRLGFSQEQVAAAAKLTQQAYSNIENDRTDQPRRSSLKAIAKKLELAEDQLFTLHPAPSRQAQDIALAYDTLPPAYQIRMMHIVVEAQANRHP